MDISFFLIGIIAVVMVLLAVLQSDFILTYVYLLLSGVTMCFFILNPNYSSIGYVGFLMVILITVLIIIEFIRGALRGMSK